MANRGHPDESRMVNGMHLGIASMRLRPGH